MMSISRHLGTRASALLDGQLPDGEARSLWAHVETCGTCQDELERERWVKTRLACLSTAFTCAPDRLKGSLLGAPAQPDPIASAYLEYADHQPHEHSRLRRTASLAAMGGGALGAAVMGVVAFGVAPASAPTTPAPQVSASSNEPSNGWPATNSRVVAYMRWMKSSSAVVSTRH
jgi:hypothetical protein